MTNEEKKEPVEPVKRQDYTLLDELTSFLYEDADPLPILCGYFHKIMDQLLLKQKQNILTYLLIEQNGKIFNALLDKLQHHSLAMILIKLLEVQIQPESRKKESWDGSDNSDFEDKEEAEPELTIEQKLMVQVLKDKTNMVVNFLIDQLSDKNQDDIHMTLNAFSVLQEFCENETLF